MFMEKLKGSYKLAVTDQNFIIDALPDETINRLHKTSKLMVDAGFEKECSDLYFSLHKQWLEDLIINKLLGLRKMGLQNYMIGRWIKALKFSLRILFPSERRLYDYVFSESTSVSSDLYFLEVCCGAMIQLLNFADSFLNRRPSVSHLFKLLIMYETLCDLIPEFESLFPSSLLNEAIKVKNRLGEVSRDVFLEIGNMAFLTPDAELDSWVNGGIHPMTCESTGYIFMVFLSKLNLEKILREYPLDVGDLAGTSSLFYLQVELIMKKFERNLEAKSQIYEDLDLRYFLMMNNLGPVEYKLETFWDDTFCNKD